MYFRLNLCQFWKVLSCFGLFLYLSWKSVRVEVLTKFDANWTILVVTYSFIEIPVRNLLVFGNFSNAFGMHKVL